MDLPLRQVHAQPAGLQRPPTGPRGQGAPRLQALRNSPPHRRRLHDHRAHSCNLDSAARHREHVQLLTGATQQRIW